MIVISGSLNKTKITACQLVFPEYKTIGKNVASDVSKQPLSDEETLKGAINRAKNALSEDSLAIGLEGGIMFMNDGLYLCSWGALTSQSGDLYTASGARIRLPDSFKNQLLKGQELGTMMEEYSKRKQVRSNEGAVGIFTNEMINRTEMFIHVVKLLRGQWEYWSLQKY